MCPPSGPARPRRPSATREKGSVSELLKFRNEHPLPPPPRYYNRLREKESLPPSSGKHTRAHLQQWRQAVVCSTADSSSSIANEDISSRRREREKESARARAFNMCETERSDHLKIFTVRSNFVSSKRNPSKPPQPLHLLQSARRSHAPNREGHFGSSSHHQHGV